MCKPSLGYLYNLNVSSAKPYSKAGDKIEISASGNESLDVIYRDTVVAGPHIDMCILDGLINL